MSTIDSVFLIITAISISLFFILFATLIIYLLVTYHRIIKKAEIAINGVENATSILREVGQNGSIKSLYKIVKFIIHLNNKTKD